MPVSKTYTIGCDVPGCTSPTVDISVPLDQTVGQNLPAGWGRWSNPEEQRYHCDDADCTTHADGVKETERAARAATRSSKTQEETDAIVSARASAKAAIDAAVAAHAAARSQE